MKHFVYNIRQLKSNLGRDRKVTLYRINADRSLTHVGDLTASFMSDGQMAVECAVKYGAVNGKHEKIKRMVHDIETFSTAPVAWENAGLARFTQV